MKRLAVLAAVALLLTGCAPAPPSEIAEKCGGKRNGFTVEGETVTYHERADVTGDAWLCALDQMVPDESDRYRIAIDLDSGRNNADFFGDYLIGWADNDSYGITLVIDPR